MSNPVRYIHNLTESDIYYVGVEFAASSATQIPYQIFDTVANTDQVYVDLAAGSIAISPDGTTVYTTLNSMIGALRGTLAQDVSITSQNAFLPPFGSKVLPNGKKLYRRVQGISASLTSSTTTLDYIIPYVSCKLTGLQVINGKVGDKANFKILDTAEGTVTTIPNYLLNQFGFNVNIAPDFADYPSSYDSDLFIGLVLRLEYISTIEDPERTIYVNLDLHEVKD